MWATRSLSVLLFVVCASNQLVAGQDNSPIGSFMSKMNTGMDGLSSQMQGLGDMLISGMNDKMGEFTSNLQNAMSGMSGQLDALSSKIQDTGEMMVNTLNDGMQQGSELMGQIMPQIQDMTQNMKSLLA